MWDEDAVAGPKLWVHTQFTPHFLASALMAVCFRPQQEGTPTELVHKGVLEALQPLVSSLRDFEAPS